MHLKSEQSRTTLQQRTYVLEQRLESGDPWSTGLPGRPRQADANTTAGGATPQPAGVAPPPAEQQQQQQQQQQTGWNGQAGNYTAGFGTNERHGQRSTGYDGKRLFDDRVAQSESNRYLDAKPHTWLKVTRNYLISRCAEGQRFLKWAEDMQKVKITLEHVIALRSESAMSDVDSVAFSEQLWGFLNLQLHGDPANLGRNKFDNVDALNGLEAWRRLVVPLESRSLSHRHGLQNLVQNPEKARSLDSVADALEVWDGNVTKYKAAGGPDMEDKEKVGVALRVMPKDIEHSIIRSLRRSEKYEDLKDSLEEEIAFVKDHKQGPSAKPSHVVDHDDHDDDEPDDEHDDEDQMEPQVLAAMLAAVGDDPALQSQVLVFADRRPFKKGGARKQFIKRKPGGRPGTPPRDAPRPGQHEPSCINCGKKGHRTADCKDARREKKDRACFRCGKAGHVIAD